MRQFFCILCDALILKKDSIFCEYCFTKLKNEKIKFRLDEHAPHCYLFSWSSKNDLFCRKLAYSLKRKPSSHFMGLASLFSPVSELLKGQFVAPTRGEKGPNHAGSFAKSLVKLYGSRGVLSVETGAKGPQKHMKSRNERLQQLTGKKGFQGDWVFVDDVFVTGATCYKISEKLGEVPRGIVTLFYKEKEF